jgi:hypothetical protein
VPEITRRTIFGAIVNVGVTQRPLETPAGDIVVDSDGAPVMQTIKVLQIDDIEMATSTIVYLEPGTEHALAEGLIADVETVA